VATALFMQNLDGTVVATALPAMARSFHANPAYMTAALTSYLVSLSVFIPASGWMADRFGARPVFSTAIGIFTLGSILCGRAPNLPFLVVARIVQGIGGAMMVPVGRLVLLRTTRKSDLVSAMAWLSAPALIGPVLGPPLGGFLTTYLSWRWVFDINVPIGALGILLVQRYVPRLVEGGRPPFDAGGFVLCAVAMASFMSGMEMLGHSSLSPFLPPGLLAVAGLAAVIYACRRAHPRPILDFRLLRIDTFMVSVLGGTLFRVGIGALPFLLPLLLQLGFGYSALQSGLVTLASSAGAILMKPAATRALRRYGFRDTLLINGTISAILLAGCALFRPAWPIAWIYAILLAGGLFRSLQFTAYNTVAYADIPREKMSAATSLYATIQQLSLTLGIVAGAAALHVAMAARGDPHPAIADFSIAFVAVGFVSLLAAPASLLMPRLAASELSGHRHPNRV
jgi:EmrB/QacA subfamily drug resistance transporter